VAEISADGGLVTFVNMFTCDPEDQQALLRTLRSETEDVVSKIDGFVSATLHASTDGRRVINYAQWTHLDAFNAMMAGEQGRQMITAVHQYAKAIDIHLYDIAWQQEIAKAAAQ
jgi:heme-degrading monooxygenase HmoA